ncbi:MAG: V-type ATP synthase subunit F [Methanobacteriota archaeon]|jgi:V/A-type H+-transporting ATPase subunit F
MKISAVGDSTTVTGFRLAGIKDAYEVEEPSKAISTLKELLKDENVGLIIISEKIADKIREDIERLTEGRFTPIVVEIPDKRGPIEKKVDPIKELVKRAVGVEIKLGG